MELIDGVCAVVEDYDSDYRSVNMYLYILHVHVHIHHVHVQVGMLSCILCVCTVLNSDCVEV